MTDPVDPGHFERMYAESLDPWQFATSAYERDKYAATLAAIGPGSFDRGLEVGCSIGVLSRQLATRCASFLGLDVVQAAIDQARLGCADQAHARFERAAVPAAWPPGGFDLIVFSEVLYYLGDAGLRETAAHTTKSLRPRGLVVLVNWLGDTGAGTTGDAAAASFIVQAGLGTVRAVRTEQYRIDVLGGPA